MSAASEAKGEALGLIAGEGPWPVELAELAAGEGLRPVIAAISARWDARLEKYPFEKFSIGEIARASAFLRGHGARRVLASGKIAWPKPWNLRLDSEGWRVLLRIIPRWGREDSALRELAAGFRRQGLKRTTPAEMWPQLTAGEGRIGAHEPGPADAADVEVAWAAVADMGVRDRGQAAVARGGAVIAREGHGHTDAMLKSVPPVTPPSGVLAKRMKPQQDRRLDPPVIGPDTVAGAARAGLRGLIVEAGGVLIAERARTLALADAKGLFIWGRRA